MRSGRPRTPSAEKLRISRRFASRNDSPFIFELGKSRSLARPPAPARGCAGVPLARDDNWFRELASELRKLRCRPKGRHYRNRTCPALVPFLLALIFALGLGAVTPAAAAQEDYASRREAAEGQFARAEALRATLEAKTERERSLQDYENLVSAYRRVYLITPNATQVPPAIKNVADLYRRMGEQFEAKYFNSAIETYAYLMREYPESSLREVSLLAIAEIRRNNLSQADLALKIYQDFLDQYPRSSYGPQVRKAIADIKAAAARPKTAPVQTAVAPPAPRASSSTAAPTSAAGGTVASSPAASTSAPSTASAGANATGGSAVAGTASGSATASASAPGQESEVSHVRIWNADNYTRIIIELGGKAKYQAARISDPDRIYFDIENAKLSNELVHQPIEIPSSGYLKAVRVAQNRADVVRVVLDVAKVKDYSVFELADPDRLVVDVYGPTDSTAAATAAAPANSAGKTSVKTVASAPAASAPSAGTAAQTPAISVPAASTPLAPTPRTARIQTPPSTAAGLLPLSMKASASLLPMPALPKVAIAATVPTSESLKSQADNIGPAPAAKPTRNGEHSLTRVLGLKIGRIVIDPGHGGHDTGTIGPTGLMEKDLCLDVALRLGKLIGRSLPSAEIVYTRQDDRYVGLEQRTAIANDARADLFISIHANSSDDARVSGIETYYLNFNASAQAMEVAARENATAQSSVHDLQDLVTKIARNEKVEESRDLAADLQESLASSMQMGKRPERNRGVRKAPFVVLVGADMPSVLAEIAFISNPADEQWLKKPENRQHAADGLYHGIERYLRSVNSLTTTIAPSVSSPRPQ
jgi:N-acetylmuramoyl-L-alanine amidase